MTTNLKTLTLALGAAALLAPTALAGKPADKPAKGKGQEKSAEAKSKSKGKGHAKAKMGNFRGTVTEVDAEAMTLTIAPTGGNKRARNLVGDAESVSFDLSSAKKLHTADHDGDGDRDLADFLAGHTAKVQARVTKDQALEGIVAKKAHNKTPGEEPSIEETESETP